MSKKLIIEGKEISLRAHQKEDYISLTDMAKSQINPVFNYTEFDIVKSWQIEHT